jgi:FlaA1/EpsC-like NDP-sugar epimerase
MAPLNRHRLWQLAVDGVLVVTAWYLAFWFRFAKTRPPAASKHQLNVYRHNLHEYYVMRDWGALRILLLSLVCFALFGFYNRWWRYVSTRDMWSAARGVTVACLVSDLVVYLAHPVHGFQLPALVALLDWLLLLGGVAGIRLVARTLIERPAAGSFVAHGREALIVGAGDAAQLIIREMQRARALNYTPIGLVDDDPRKKNLRIHGVKVLGTLADLPHLLRDNKPDEVVIAIPSASGAVRQAVVEVAREAGVPVKTLPGLWELLSGDLSAQIRPVQVEDVLGREQIEVDVQALAAYLEGQTVLVTGAGGSIGSELCRQITRHGKPQQLVMLDHAETPLFEIERELLEERGFKAVAPVLADAGNEVKLRQVFERFRPTIVFHAAAYKHVPLMEMNPLEAVRNNALATRAIARVACDAGVERFVLVSTDKAANPQTVMGQCKALCEWIVEALGHRDDVATRFVAVRFGNVLASSGSVIPIFRKQIERGGPVTVTHPEMTRYFMTIPEAVSLVIQAGSIADRGQVYVLDMGEPVKILDLARNMIRLSGKEPDRDVAISFVGTRPGEKLHEDLWGDEEQVAPSEHPKIMRLTREPVDGDWLDERLDRLERLVADGDGLAAVRVLAETTRAARRSAAELLPTDS